MNKMDKKYFFLIGFFVIFFLFLVSSVSATVCSVPGAYNQTDYCGIDSRTKPLLEDYYSCLNDYECAGGSCVFANRAGCEGEVNLTKNANGTFISCVEHAVADCPESKGCIENDQGTGCIYGGCEALGGSQEACNNLLECKYDIYTSSCIEQPCGEWNYDQVGCMEAKGCLWNTAIPPINACIGGGSCGEDGTGLFDCASLSMQDCEGNEACSFNFGGGGAPTCDPKPCTDWNNNAGRCNSITGCAYNGCGDNIDEASCSSAGCSWQGEAYCEAKFKEVKEQTGFLQTMLDRIIAFFSGGSLFGGSEEDQVQTALDELELGGVPRPANVQASVIRDQDPPKIELTWKRALNVDSILKFNEQVDREAVSEITRIWFASETPAVQDYTNDYNCEVNESDLSGNDFWFCENDVCSTNNQGYRCDKFTAEAICNNYGFEDYIDGTMVCDGTVHDFGSFGLPGGVFSDVCVSGQDELDRRESYGIEVGHWITELQCASYEYIEETVTPSCSGGALAANEVCVAFKDTGYGGCFKNLDGTIICDQNFCSNEDEGLKCDENTAGDYCRELGYSGYKLDSKTCTDGHKEIGKSNRTEQVHANYARKHFDCFESNNEINEYTSSSNSRWIETLKCVNQVEDYCSDLAEGEVCVIFDPESRDKECSVRFDGTIVCSGNTACPSSDLFVQTEWPEPRFSGLYYSLEAANNYCEALGFGTVVWDDTIEVVDSPTGYYFAGTLPENVDLISDWMCNTISVGKDRNTGENYKWIKKMKCSEERGISARGPYGNQVALNTVKVNFPSPVNQGATSGECTYDGSGSTSYESNYDCICGPNIIGAVDGKVVNYELECFANMCEYDSSKARGLKVDADAADSYCKAIGYYGYVPDTIVDRSSSSKGFSWANRNSNPLVGTCDEVIPTGQSTNKRTIEEMECYKRDPTAHERANSRWVGDSWEWDDLKPTCEGTDEGEECIVFEYNLERGCKRILGTGGGLSNRRDSYIQCDLNFCTEPNVNFPITPVGLECHNDAADNYCKSLGYAGFANDDSLRCTEFLGATMAGDPSESYLNDPYGMDSCDQTGSNLNWIKSMNCATGVTMAGVVDDYTIYRSNSAGLLYLDQGLPFSQTDYTYVTNISSEDACGIDETCSFIDPDTIGQRLGQGDYYYLVIAGKDDVDSGYSNEARVNFITDTERPQASIDSITNGQTYLSNDPKILEVEFSVSDNVGVADCKYLIVNSDFPGEYQGIGCGEGIIRFTKDSWREDGENVLYFNVTDLFGNTKNIYVNFHVEHVPDTTPPEMGFIAGTTPDSLQTELSTVQTNVDVVLSVVDPESPMRNVTIYLYKRGEGIVYEEEGELPSSGVFSTIISDLEYGTYFLNATAINRDDLVGESETRVIVLSDVERVVSPPPVVEFLAYPEEIGTYYPTTPLEVHVNVSDNAYNVDWSLISSESGHIDGGILSSGKGDWIIPFTLPRSLTQSVVEHTITLEAIDNEGWPSSTSITITVANEDCEDNFDNDDDGIKDGFDRDCSTTEIAITDMLAVQRVVTHRTLDVNCVYDTTSTDEEGIMQCVKLNVSGNNCAISDLEESASIAKFRNCETGGKEQINADISCYVNPECYSSANNVLTKKIGTYLYFNYLLIFRYSVK